MEAQQDQQVQASKKNANDDDNPQAVRFASVNQEIEPVHSLQSASQTQTSQQPQFRQETAAQSDDAIKKLAMGLHNSHIQQRRMSNFAFEPCSLPVSRVPSNESTPNQSTREPTRSGGPSPRVSPPASAMTTPPLTPHGTQSANIKDESANAGLAKVHPDPVIAAPQMSPPKIAPSAPGEASSTNLSMSQPSTGEQASTRPTSLSPESSSENVKSRKAGGFTIGPSGSTSSQSPSREPSPSSKAPNRPRDSAIPPPARPRTPVANKDDPYARSKRPPQSKSTENLEPRFKFGSMDARRRSGINFAPEDNSTNSTPQSSGKESKNEHRKSTLSLFGGHHAQNEKHDKADRPHGSMSNLTRFFGFAHHHKSKRSASPAPPARGSVDKSGSSTPPRQGSSIAVPFGEDHGLEKKYGKFTKLLGSGAGGSVRLLKRSSDNTTFAVKQFRDRHNHESVREYNKKITAEFCIGSTLHHENIIETLDIIQEGPRWYQVMEYAPYDLFAIVMTGKMTREEITCCFLQIVNGVTFLHASGLAHRDLKLDNVVVNDRGIMKIIDFGSASVFRYPFENDIILASGVVGSDPYLAPEVYNDHKKYDPQPADIWSLAIIFACMSLRRFPWKAPRMTDNSFKLFVAEPNTTSGDERSKSTTEHSGTSSDNRETGDPSTGQNHHHHHHHHRHDPDKGEVPGKDEQDSRSDTTSQATRPEGGKGEPMKGPWRLLRLLPRETRNIIAKMLHVDPRDRATLEDMHADVWVRNAPVCHQTEAGYLPAGTHKHILEPGSSTPAPSKT